MQFVQGLTVLVVFSVIGQWIHLGVWSGLPGPVLGMVLLLLWLMVRGRVPESLDVAARALLAVFPLLLVVPSAGIIVNGAVLRDEGVAILVALVVSLMITMPFCGWLAQRLIRRQRQRRGRSAS